MPRLKPVVLKLTDKLWSAKNVYQLLLTASPVLARLALGLGYHSASERLRSSQTDQILKQLRAGVRLQLLKLLDWGCVYQITADCRLYWTHCLGLELGSWECPQDRPGVELDHLHITGMRHWTPSERFANSIAYLCEIACSSSPYATSKAAHACEDFVWQSSVRPSRKRRPEMDACRRSMAAASVSVQRKLPRLRWFSQTCQTSKPASPSKSLWKLNNQPGGYQ